MDVDSADPKNQEDLRVSSPGSKTLQFKMSRTLITVHDVWKEWTEGLGGWPSVIQMEREHKTRWRNKSEGDKKLFQRRKVIIDCVHSICKNRGYSVDLALRKMEEVRVAYKWSLAKLQDQLKLHVKDPALSVFHFGADEEEQEVVDDE